MAASPQNRLSSSFLSTSESLINRVALASIKLALRSLPAVSQAFLLQHVVSATWSSKPTIVAGSQVFALELGEVSHFHVAVVEVFVLVPLRMVPGHFAELFAPVLGLVRVVDDEPVVVVEVVFFFIVASGNRPSWHVDGFARNRSAECSLLQGQLVVARPRSLRRHCSGGLHSVGCQLGQSLLVQVFVVPLLAAETKQTVWIVLWVYLLGLGLRGLGWCLTSRNWQIRCGSGRGVLLRNRLPEFLQVVDKSRVGISCLLITRTSSLQRIIGWRWRQLPWWLSGCS